MSWSTVASSVFFALLALFSIVAAWELRRILTARVPAQVQQTFVGHAKNAPPPIPKIVWAYWHQIPVPDFIAKCQANWRQFAPDHELRLLHQGNIRDWLQDGELLQRLDALPPYRQADWLRLQLLAAHGGIWIDASILLCQSLAWVHKTQIEQGSEFVGFYISRFTSRPDQPIVENWFMAAQPASPFVKALAAEFDLAITMGEEAYLAALDQQGVRARVVQALGPKDQIYLIMHVAAAVVLDRHPLAYSLALSRAEDSALAFHAALGWRKRHMFACLALLPCPKRLPMLIKLRGGDRRVFERGVTLGKVRKGSALARLLPPYKQQP